MSLGNIRKCTHRYILVNLHQMKSRFIFTSPYFIFSSTGLSICNGDSGGPLACKKDGKFYVHGASSFVSSSGCAARPPVFTRVAEFADWINFIIDNNSGMSVMSKIKVNRCSTQNIYFSFCFYLISRHNNPKR